MPRQSLVLAVSSDTNHRSTKPRNKPSVMPIMIRHSTAVTVRIDLAWLTDNKPRERETSVREIMRWRGDNFAGITQETIYISNISISYFTRNFSLFIISLFHLNPTVTSNSKKREFNFDKILFTVTIIWIDTIFCNFCVLTSILYKHDIWLVYYKLLHFERSRIINIINQWRE